MRKEALYSSSVTLNNDTIWQVKYCRLILSFTWGMSWVVFSLNSVLQRMEIRSMDRTVQSTQYDMKITLERKIWNISFHFLTIWQTKLFRSWSNNIKMSVGDLNVMFRDLFQFISFSKLNFTPDMYQDISGLQGYNTTSLGERIWSIFFVAFNSDYQFKIIGCLHHGGL